MESHTPLGQAWLAILTQQAMGQPTYVLYDPHDGEAFIQLRYRPHQAAADVVFMAPSLAEHQRATNAWAHLLDGACIEVAGQGIQRVFGSLPASGDEVDVFQQAGFTLYGEEDLYRFAPEPGLQAEPLPALRPQRPEDWPALQKLCVAITPQRVRQAEGGIALTAGWEKNCRRYVVPAEESGDLVAALTICTGVAAHWLQVLVHPNPRHQGESGSDEHSRQGLAELLLHWGVVALAAQPVPFIYCSVRQYENGLREAMQALGFEPVTTRALMFKHTLAWVKAPAHEPASALQSSAEAVPPAYRIDQDQDLAGPDARLAAEMQHD